METFKLTDKQGAMTEEAPIASNWESVSALEGKSEEVFRAEVVAKVVGYGVSPEVAQKLVSELDYHEWQTSRFLCIDDMSGVFDPDDK